MFLGYITGYFGIKIINFDSHLNFHKRSLSFIIEFGVISGSIIDFL
jgi:hypothetical protein